MWSSKVKVQVAAQPLAYKAKGVVHGFKPSDEISTTGRPLSKVETGHGPELGEGAAFVGKSRGCSPYFAFAIVQYA